MNSNNSDYPLLQRLKDIALFGDTAAKSKGESVGFQGMKDACAEAAAEIERLRGTKGGSMSNSDAQSEHPCSFRWRNGMKPCPIPAKFEVQLSADPTGLPPVLRKSSLGSHS